MKFPIKKYYKVNNFTEDYFESLKNSFKSINIKDLEKVINILDRAYKDKNIKILVCGNGGSAALANHFA